MKRSAMYSFFVLLAAVTVILKSNVFFAFSLIMSAIVVLPFIIRGITKGWSSKSGKNLLLKSLLIMISVLCIGCSELEKEPSVTDNNNKTTITAIPSKAEEDNVAKDDKLEEDRKSDVKVHFIDVGQGDSVLIESDGHYMLIDAGENDQGKTVVSYLEGLGVKKLDFVVGTHPHSDHIGGLDTVIRSFNVGKIILPPKEHTTKTYEDVLDAIDAKKLKITKPVVGKSYEIGSANFIVVAPNGEYGNDLNNWSVGIRLVNGNTSFLFTGDAEKDSEEKILKSGQELKSNVFKLGHHGSDTSNMQEFLDAVDPSIAVISVGEGNSYGHPHKEVLQRLETMGVEILRTDKLGNIVLSSNGNEIHLVDKNGSLQVTDSKPSKAETDININTGTNTKADTNAKKETNTKTDTKKETNIKTDTNTKKETDKKTNTYILNTKTKKFHDPFCYSAEKINSSNKKSYEGTREKLISDGYDSCGNCNP